MTLVAEWLLAWFGCGVVLEDSECVRASARG